MILEFFDKYCFNEKYQKLSLCLALLCIALKFLVVGLVLGFLADYCDLGTLANAKKSYVVLGSIGLFVAIYTFFFLIDYVMCRLSGMEKGFYPFFVFSAVLAAMLIPFEILLSSEVVLVLNVIATCYVLSALRGMTWWIYLIFLLALGLFGFVLALIGVITYGALTV